MKARIAWCLARLEATEKGLERTVNTEHHILQDLGVDLGVLRHRRLDAG